MAYGPMAASVDFDGDDDLLPLGFHGFGNDEMR